MVSKKKYSTKDFTTKEVFDSRSGRTIKKRELKPSAKSVQNVADKEKKKEYFTEDMPKREDKRAKKEDQREKTEDKGTLDSDESSLSDKKKTALSQDEFKEEERSELESKQDERDSKKAKHKKETLGAKAAKHVAKQLDSFREPPVIKDNNVDANSGIETIDFNINKEQKEKLESLFVTITPDKGNMTVEINTKNLNFFTDKEREALHKEFDKNNIDYKRDPQSKRYTIEIDVMNPNWEKNLNFVLNTFNISGEQKAVILAKARNLRNKRVEQQKASQENVDVKLSDDLNKAEREQKTQETKESSEKLDATKEKLDAGLEQYENTEESGKDLRDMNYMKKSEKSLAELEQEILALNLQSQALESKMAKGANIVSVEETHTALENSEDLESVDNVASITEIVTSDEEYTKEEEEEEVEVESTRGWGSTNTTDSCDTPSLSMDSINLTLSDKDSKSMSPPGADLSKLQSNSSELSNALRDLDTVIDNIDVEEVKESNSHVEKLSAPSVSGQSSGPSRA